MTVAPLKTVAEAAAWLGVGEYTVAKAVSSRRWPHTRVGRHVRFSQQDLDRIVEICRVEQTTRALPRRSGRAS